MRCWCLLGVATEYRLEDDLNMESSIGDPALYVKVSDGNLEEIMVLYVDDHFNAGNHTCEEITPESLNRFESNPRVNY